MAAALAKARFESAMHSLPPKVQKFFNTHLKKGENFELKTELNSEYRDRRKEAVKRVIANMTVGKDVSGLFTDVLKCMQTDDLELKKLVYLYLMNYAKSQPELVILAVNSFVKDSEDPNPLIRALAVRTMGCLRAEKIVDYLTDPLRKALRDPDPYVRKTAAICVAKLFDLKPQLTIDNGFITQLQDLLSDSNPMVVANSMAALRDIQAQGHAQVFVLHPVILHKLLAALNECTEWGQICILECLSEYTPTETSEFQLILDRVVPRLSHINTAVVLAAIRVLLVYMEYDAPTITQSPGLLKKLTTSLISLINASPSLTYVALRNIQLILQRRPDLLQADVRMFFCQYNDPLFVKLEKLKLLLSLTTTDQSIDPVLQELKEYAKEVDVTFVKQAVLAMGQLGLQLESAADRCIHVLLELAQMGVTHTLQTCLITFKDLVRRYPKKFDAVVGAFLAQVEPGLEFDQEEESQSAFFWLLAHCYPQFVGKETLQAHLQPYAATFVDLASRVQCQLLATAMVCYLHAPALFQPFLQQLLQTATSEVEDPDVRDRAFIFWRLLAHPHDALPTVLSADPAPRILPPEPTLPLALVQSLLRHLGTLASVTHQLPTDPALVAALPTGALSASGTGGAGVGAVTAAGGAAYPHDDNDDDEAWVLVMAKDQGQGLELHMGFAATPSTLYLQATNHTSQPLTDLALQFNLNTLGLTPTPLPSDLCVAPSSTLVIPVMLQVQQAMLKPTDPANLLQIAIKSNPLGILYFSVFLPETWMDTGACLL